MHNGSNNQPCNYQPHNNQPVITSHITTSNNKQYTDHNQPYTNIRSTNINDEYAIHQKLTQNTPTENPEHYHT